MQKTKDILLKKRNMSVSKDGSASKKLKKESVDKDQTREVVTKFNGGLRPLDLEFAYETDPNIQWRVLDEKCSCNGNCDFGKGHHIFDATLNQCNIGQNNNKFYIIQVLTNERRNFLLYTRWGRQGAKGQNAQKNFTDKESAHFEFFKKKRAKLYDYTELQLAYGDEENLNATKKEKTPQKEENLMPSKLTPEVSTLVKLIFNTDIIQNSIKEIGYDQKKMPLGKLSKLAIDTGYACLKRIEEKINNNLIAFNKSGMQYILDKLSSEFYTHIPTIIPTSKAKDFIIDTHEKLKEKIEMLEQLEAIKVSVELIDGVDQNSLVSQTESNYKKLEKNIHVIEKDTECFKTIKDFIKLGQGPTHTKTFDIIDIYQIEYPENSLDNNPYFNSKNKGVKHLLFHGSRVSNFAGIISQGLRIAPPHVPVHGYMFGKGIYLADTPSKASNYCSPELSNSYGILLMCEAHVGATHDMHYSDYQAPEKMSSNQKNSVKGLGRLGPLPGNEIMFDGNILKMGPIGDQTPTGKTLIYNEFVVYDVRQVKMKYMALLKFHN